MEQSFEVEATLANLPAIIDFVTEQVEHLHPDARTLHQVQLAVDEACTNVIKHAYADYPGKIRVELEVVCDELVINIKDRGKSFDPSIVPAPDLDSDWEDRRVGGLGIHLMTMLMDSVTYTTDDEGNGLKMTKRLSGCSGNDKYEGGSPRLP